MRYLILIFSALLFSFTSFAVLPITGSNTVCIGSTVTMSDATPGGTWSSSNTSVATIDTGTGIYTGITVGTSIISYTVSGVSVTTTVTVNLSPKPISGATNLCNGTMITMTDTVSGGTWSTGSTIISLGSASGTVTGLANGTATITYKLPTGCPTTISVTVNPNPAVIGGIASLCVSNTTTLSETTPGGIWHSSSPSIADTLSGGGTSAIINGIAAGTATITYTISSTACYASKIVTVNSIPGITGNRRTCIANTTTLSDTSPGGTWSSNNTAIATIGISSGIVAGVSAGTSMITYTSFTGCMVTAIATVNPIPAAITGASAVCIGSVITLSDATGGGTWASSNSSIASVLTSSGTVTGHTAGTITITYAIFTTGCATSTTITVGLTSSAISGPATMCVGTNITLSDASAGGTWSSSNTAVATIGSGTGIASALSLGTATITYGAGSCAAYTTLSVYPSPTAITGLSNVCSGSTIALSDAIGGGTWSSSTASIATIGSSGIVSGVAAGSDTIVYTLTGGCDALVAITVYTPPTPITGPTSVCQGITLTLSDAVTGGSWSSSNTSVAAIGSSSGICTGIGAGSAVVSYTIPASGCSSSVSITVDPTPAAIAGTATGCVGATATLSDADPGGVWTSNNTAIAAIGSGSGIVTPLSAGTNTISYTFPSTGCFTTTTIAIDALPAITASTFSTCSNMDTLAASGAATYSWAPASGLSCSTCATTSVSPATTTTYTVTGTSPAGCQGTATVTLNGNRIFGHVTFGGPTPDTLDMKVWLIQYNPADSSITALDSTLTCVVDSITYYEFDGKPSGNYMTKAMLLYGNTAGASGYIPTYSLSASHWDSASTVSHSGGSDSLHITMIYGTVPSGPGFISGYVYSGAGKGATSDAPVSGMIIYLENTASQVVGHTYTDASGYYSFSNFAYGDYAVYPEDYVYKTTPSGTVTLNDSRPAANNVDFRQFTTSKIIIPYSYPSGIKTVSITNELMVYPNPNTGSFTINMQSNTDAEVSIIITDIIGTKVNTFTAKTNTPVDIHMNEAPGVYFIYTKTAGNFITQKILVQ